MEKEQIQKLQEILYELAVEIRCLSKGLPPEWLNEMEMEIDTLNLN